MSGTSQEPVGTAAAGARAGISGGAPHRPLEGHYLHEPFDPAALPAHPLAVIRYGTDPARPEPRPAAGCDWLDVSVPFEQLGPDPLVEVWTAEGPVRRGELGGLRYAATDGVLLGVLEVDVAARPLEPAAHATYLELLEAVERLGYPELLRMWNAVPRINEPGAGPERGTGLDRYMLFCRGRSLAFEHRYGRGFARRLPSASAVGSAGTRLVVHFLAGRADAHHVENPRQVAAYEYPERYGPRSPSFARATRAPAELGAALFVSGTASVVGHESVHVGDPSRQLAETMRNIESLLRHADVTGVPPRMLKVYLRDPRDVETTRQQLDRILGGTPPAIYLRGDICRPELLVEIEAIV